MSLTLQGTSGGQLRPVPAGGVSTVPELPGICGFRLTPLSGSPYEQESTGFFTTIYFTPSQKEFSSYISLYDGSRWNLHQSSEISAALATTATLGYGRDMFVYDNAGTLTIEQVLWTDNLTRATALVLQDNVWVKSGDTTRLYVGTVPSSSVNNNSIHDYTRRLVFNNYNRHPCMLMTGNSTNTSTSSTSGWHQPSGQGSLLFTSGLTDTYMEAEGFMVGSDLNDDTFAVGIGLDVTNAVPATMANATVGGTVQSNGDNMLVVAPFWWRGYPQLVRASVDVNVLASVIAGTITYIGDNGTTDVQKAGFNIKVWM